MNEKIEIGKYYINKNYRQKFNEKTKGYEFEEIDEKLDLVYCFGKTSFENTDYTHLPFDNSDYPLKKLINFVGISVYPSITLNESKDHFSWITAYKNSHIPIKNCENENYNHEWIAFEPSQNIKERFQKKSCFMEIEKMFNNHMIKTYKKLYENQNVSVRQIYDIKKIKK